MKELRHLSAAMLLAFVVVAFSALYWSIAGPEGILLREDNPRLVERENATLRGNIYDRAGLLLATTRVNSRTGELERLYPHPETAPVVGYYSFRYGTNGIEATYDTLLSGQEGVTPFTTLTREMLHYPREGGDVRLTLDLSVQKSAEDALSGFNGAAIVVTLPDGAVRALVSQPDYDPNVLNENWDHLVTSPDAPLLNRVTQGLYQPGGYLQTPLLALAIASQHDTNTPLTNSAAPVALENLALVCSITPPQPDLTLQEAYIYGCPGAFAQTATQFDPTELDAAFLQFGLLTAPPLNGLPTETGDSPLPLANEQDELGFLTGALGQGALTITPLQAMQIIVAAANGGTAPRFNLVEATRLPGGSIWAAQEETTLPQAMLTRQTAQQIQLSMQAASANGGVAEAAQVVTEFPVLGHAATAYAGQTEQPLQWFVGIVRSTNGAVVTTLVVLENAPTPQVAARAGGMILDAAAEAFIAAPKQLATISATLQP